MKNNNSKSIKRSLSSAGRILAVLFGIGFIVGFLLTPLGFETRMPELRSLAFAGYFIIVGLLIPIIGLVSIWLGRTRLAGALAVINAILIFLTGPADQAKFFFTLSPPPAVTIGEYILIFIGVGYMLYGPKVYAEKRIQDTNLTKEQEK
jgi:hypothetical protein